MPVGPVALLALVRLLGHVADPVFVQRRLVLELLAADVTSHVGDASEGRGRHDAVRLHQMALQQSHRLVLFAAVFTGQIHCGPESRMGKLIHGEGKHWSTSERLRAHASVRSGNRTPPHTHARTHTHTHTHTRTASCNRKLFCYGFYRIVLKPRLSFQLQGHEQQHSSISHFSCNKARALTVIDWPVAASAPAPAASPLLRSRSDQSQSPSSFCPSLRPRSPHSQRSHLHPRYSF